MAFWDTIVVGAGPCGLSCAASFTAAGVSTLVLEKGCLVDSIYRFPAGMRFFSGPEGLQIGASPMRCEDDRPTRNEALAYYRGVPARQDSEYVAFDVREHATRLHIQRATQPSRFPAYNYLLDIFYDSILQACSR